MRIPRMAELRSYWVTVRLDPGRTKDFRVKARSEWSAGWLWRQLHPADAVLMVREVKG